MKILWVNNIAIPKIAEDVGMVSVPVGGWMVKLADELAKKEEIELGILFPYQKNLDGCVGKIKYFSFFMNPSRVRIGDLGGQDVRIREVIENFSPDVIHIFGTEYLHSYVVTRVCEKLGRKAQVAVSIQGLTSVYARHYYACLDFRTIYARTLRDCYKGNVRDGKREYEASGKFEIETLKSVNHVIGRTEWDRACTQMINPQAAYHFNNEMLRDAFYHASPWNFESCKKHHIFMSQASSPVKGLHLALEAFSVLKRDYPDLKVSIAGKSYYQKKPWTLSYYEKSILKYIREHQLEGAVEFLGFLDEGEMCRQYLDSHVFVSASSIENSPNSLCEAMILGVPVVSSMVGGVNDLMEHGKDGYYYQADAPYMLAHYVKKIFENEELAKRFSEHARTTAQKRHAVDRIVAELCEIYEEIGS